MPAKCFSIVNNYCKYDRKVKIMSFLQGVNIQWIYDCRRSHTAHCRPYLYYVCFSLTEGYFIVWFFFNFEPTLLCHLRFWDQTHQRASSNSVSNKVETYTLDIDSMEKFPLNFLVVGHKYCLCIPFFFFTIWLILVCLPK